MLSRPPIQKFAAMGVIIQLKPFIHEFLSEDYKEDVDFGDVF
jgi:hypothetical protein